MDRLKQNRLVLGLDVGSVSISVVMLDRDGNVRDERYALHHGDTRATLEKLLETLDTRDVAGIASPSGNIRYHGMVRRFHPQVCLVTAADGLGLKARSILHIGAERFYLIERDAGGAYLQTRHSSSCAAGTGSFLDQQASRLGLENAAQLSSMAMENRSPVPGIAARCSVFAKTDLIHAQQKGFGLGAICDSLCRGLSENVADTLFKTTPPLPPVVMSGGVSLNGAVRSCLEERLGTEILVHSHSHHLPAIGAAMMLWEEMGSGAGPVELPRGSSLLDESRPGYYHRALPKPEGLWEDIEVAGTGLHSPSGDHPRPVETERYRAPETDDRGFYLGLDIGSTSTKAVLVNAAGRPFAGFYTYTCGQPLRAVQALFEAIYGLLSQAGGACTILGCSTTGSGRKFIGTLVGADFDVDEITAHARAACELDPRTDTIIEIGGQDSKFTRIKDGEVTFSHMNTVCAAGTGSFIEELAGRLGVGLENLGKAAIGKPAPLASDRCTVFMERDVNQLLSQGYKVEEVLATVIHSVMENYLRKVAGESRIGEHICFQGATARNGALVAAFRERLGKPVAVSRLCHLTGALGAALILREEGSGDARFRGLDLFREEIPVRNETCRLCLNRCSITVAEVRGETVAYGFLCGRDYKTRSYVKKERNALDLIGERERIRGTGKTERVTDRGKNGSPGNRKGGTGIAIGIPATLHMQEDLFFWKEFFRRLGIPVISSEHYKESLKEGKKIAGAEFCAPVDSMYGHISYLSERCSHLFFPVYLETRVPSGRTEENYCYYTQYSASLAYLEGAKNPDRLLSPMLDFRKNGEYNPRVLRRTLQGAGWTNLTTRSVAQALSGAREADRAMRLRLQSLFNREFGKGERLSVMLLGRPYVVLSETLNKGIPEVFARNGVNAFYQDMIPLPEEQDEGLEQLIAKVPWHFASQLLRAADQAGRTENLYPVLITAFKCAPDSFIVEYFKDLMHRHEKPYLVIQIDQHDSNVGYETRIEAALRSFRGHARSARPARPDPGLEGILPRIETSLKEKTVLMPNWDPYVGPLVVANLRRAGFDARLLESSEMTIRKSMVHNTGQCLPVSIITQEYIDYVKKHGLDPGRTILWMMEARLTCNIRQYPFFIKHMLDRYGQGMEHASVYSGELTHRELSLQITYYAYFAYMLGGLFRKVACRIRPYEREQGSADAAAREVQQILIRALSGKQSVDSAIREGISRFRQVEYDRKTRKPLVAVFGDLYVRDNETMNQDLVKVIEEAGGEVVVTPYHDYTKLIIENVFRRAEKRGEHVETTVNRVILQVLKFMDERYYRYFAPFLGPAPVIRPRKLEQHLSRFRIDRLHSGESYDNILKIFHIIDHYPGISLFVQTNPSFCCPALVTEAMTRRIREITGIPVVTLTYDGTSDRINDQVVPYIRQSVSAKTAHLPGKSTRTPA